MAWRAEMDFAPCGGITRDQVQRVPAVCGISAGRASAPAIDAMSVVDRRRKGK
jgi:hypothetical protein